MVADLERYLDVTRGEMLFAEGVILVEGEAERFLVPALAKANGVNFDELGISVCSVAGTNFGPYVALLGERGLRLPVAVITDGDPVEGGAKRGEARVLELLRATVPEADLARRTSEQQLAIAAERGFFLGDYTCEVDLFRSGAHDEIGQTLMELAAGNAARTRAQGWRANPATLEPVQFLKDITAISKGRFAQRLSTRIIAGNCPAYLANGIDYVRTRCR